MSNPAIMFIAGDPSGDQHTAPIIACINREISGSACYGIGGAKMQAEGFNSFLPFEKFNRMGYVEVISNFPFFLKAKRILLQKMKTLHPDLVVCVDYSGFNTLIMKAAYKLNIPVVWYIAPKIWAWKKKKHTTNLKKYATHIAVIFPFEVEAFMPYTKAVSFVGNPLVEFIDSRKYTCLINKTNDLKNRDKIRLAIVPGSRLQEIKNILPSMIIAYEKLIQIYPNITATISRCNNIPLSFYKQFINNRDMDLFEGLLEDMFSLSDLALVTSGTATLQAALMGIPMVIAYKTSFVSYTIYKALIKNVRFIGLPNIIANEKIVPECIQKNITPDNLLCELKMYIESQSYYRRTVEKLVALKENLGIKQPSKEVTNIIKKVLEISSPPI